MRVWCPTGNKLCASAQPLPRPPCLFIHSTEYKGSADACKHLAYILHAFVYWSCVQHTRYVSRFKIFYGGCMWGGMGDVEKWWTRFTLDFKTVTLAQPDSHLLGAKGKSMKHNEIKLSRITVKIGKTVEKCGARTGRKDMAHIAPGRPSGRKLLLWIYSITWLLTLVFMRQKT